jgi:PAS domain S-box-containing protein
MKEANSPTAPIGFPDYLQVRRIREGNEERYRILVDMAPDAILVHQDWVVVYCNIAALRLYHASSYEEIIGRDHLDLVHPKDRESIMGRARSVMDGNITTLHRFRHIGLDGREIPVETMAAPVDWDGRPAIQVIVRDITPRIQAEEKLRKSEERLRLAVESARLMVHDHDVRTGTVLAFHGMSDLLGYEETEAGYTLDWWEDLIHPDDVSMCHAAMEQTLSGRRDHKIQYRVRHRDGRYLFVEGLTRPVCDDAGRVVRIIGTVTDITERKLAELELQRNRGHLEDLVRERTAQLEARNVQLAEEINERTRAEKELQKIQEEISIHFRQSNDVMYSYSRDFRILSVTPNVERLLGYRPDELVGKAWYELDILDKQDVEKAMGHAMLAFSGKSVQFANYRFSAKDGRVMIGEVSGIPLKRDGEVIGVISVARDVTERIRTEDEKKKLENELLQVQKMEALGRFAGGIAHDLNNLLYPIVIDAEMLMEETRGNEGAQEALRHILSAAYRQRDLVKQILSFSRRNDQVFHPIQVSPLVHETLALMRSSLPSSIYLRHSINAAEDTVMGNSTQIQQIIMNLCRNSADSFEYQTGTIEVSLENTGPESPAGHPDRKEGRQILLTVKDTGSGIRPEIMDRIFEPFFTTKETGKGSGMGLAVVHGIVRSHGGSITVRSKPGRGSEFRVSLPLCTGRQAAADAGHAEKLPVNRRGKILLVDDEELVLFSLQQALQRAGYQVVAVQNSMEGCSRFREDPGAFDVVLTDMTMPGLSGVELAKQLLDIRADIPVILCTGYSDIVDEQEAKRIGIREMLSKPSNIFDINRSIRRALDTD